MHDRLAAGQLATGTITLNHGLEIVELLGYSGLDFVCIDMMVTSLDWSEVATMVLAARAYNVTPWVRLSTFPWGTGEDDPGLPSNVLKAFAVGAECVLASVNSASQVERLQQTIEHSHRRFYIRQGGLGRTYVQKKLDAAEAELRFVPIIESVHAIKNIDAILAVPDLKMIYMGMGDLTKALGYPGQDRHPEVVVAIKHIVEEAAKRKVVVCANALGYQHGAELSGLIAETADSLWQAGVRAVLMPRPTQVIQNFYESTLSQVRERLGSSYT